MSRMLPLAAALALIAAAAAPAGAATLTISGSGQLTGATGVDVGGTLYDVSFVDGTCASVFDGCDSVSDFTFQVFADATAASQALLDQVFLDTGSGAFDTNPALTLGCSTAIGGLACVASTPYFVNVTADQIAFTVAINSPAVADAPSTFTAFSRSSDFSSAQSSNFVWAKFVAQTSGIPEPATWLMMLLGFAAIGASLRKGGEPSIGQGA